jgi:hypothetical protein
MNMVLRLIEGFEHGDVDALPLTSSTMSIATANVRSGSGARYLDLTGSSAYVRFGDFPWDAANDTLYAGFAINFRGLQNGDFCSIGGYPTGQDTDDSWITLEVTTSGEIKVWMSQTQLSPSGTLLDTTAVGTIVTDTWHYVEVEFLCHESAGTVEVWVDGVSAGSFAGDTMAEATAGNKPDLGFLYIVAPSSNDVEVDDVYVLDTNTTSPEGGTSPHTGRLGDIIIEALTPTSDSTPNDFTRSAGANNFELVDDIPPDDDTTYVESSTAAHEDRYGLSNRTLTGTVVGAAIYTRHKKDDANARSLDIGLVSNAGATVDPNAVTTALANGTYTTTTKTYDRDFHDGATAADWTEAKINALETSAVVV